MGPPPLAAPQEARPPARRTMSAAAGLQPLLETLEDPAAPPGELTDAHLAIVRWARGPGGGGGLQPRQAPGGAGLR